VDDVNVLAPVDTMILITRAYDSAIRSGVEWADEVKLGEIFSRRLDDFQGRMPLRVKRAAESSSNEMLWRRRSGEVVTFVSAV
jgi:hypothetical protein